MNRAALNASFVDFISKNSPNCLDRTMKIGIKLKAFNGILMRILLDNKQQNVCLVSKYKAWHQQFSSLGAGGSLLLLN